MARLYILLSHQTTTHKTLKYTLDFEEFQIHPEVTFELMALKLDIKLDISLNSICPKYHKLAFSASQIMHITF